MKEIPLSNGMVALVDDADYEAVMQFKWHAWVNKRGNWYAQRNVRKPDGTWTTQKLHNFLMPGLPMVDHWDGDGLDNRRKNLRPCTRAQNQHNRRRNGLGSSKSKGVSWHVRCKKWQVRIKFEGKRYHLGYFPTEKDAAHAYDVAAKKFHKEFARLNFQ